MIGKRLLSLQPKVHVVRGASEKAGRWLILLTEHIDRPLLFFRWGWVEAEGGGGGWVWGGHSWQRLLHRFGLGHVQPLPALPDLTATKSSCE